MVENHWSIYFNDILLQFYKLLHANFRLTVIEFLNLAEGNFAHNQLCGSDRC